MKSILLIIACVLSGGLIIAQNSDFLIKTGSKGLYLEHKVSSKENFFSIGRLYNVHPRNIARFNGMEMSKGLSLGQMLNIPLTDTNLNRQTGIGVPLYFVSSSEQPLGSVGKIFGVTVNNLRNWNEISGNEMGAGEKIIVAFLNTKELRAFAVDLSAKQAGEKKVSQEPVVSKPKVEEKVTRKEESNKRDDVKKTEPLLVKHDGKSGLGFFKPDFEKQIRKYPITKEMMVTSGIFKTTSGWQDAKYYLLIDRVEPGTIIKITNPINNKAVYAKVLYGMEGIRQNEGLDIRISNAAAAALEITETDKFVIKVNY